MAIHANVLTWQLCVCVKPIDQNCVNMRKEQRDILLQQNEEYW
jgi:hypothetical protein